MDRDALQSRVAPLKGRRVVVMGLGRFGGGIAVSKWLVEQGARVLVTDKDSAEKLADSVGQLAGLPVELRLGEHRHEDFREAELVVASPAVKLDDAYLATARAAGVPITTEIRLFVERCPARRVAGVTGTKGKSTTTAMLGGMLARRFKTWVGGNIGRSLLADLPAIGADDVVVLELSSFMLAHLEALSWSPHVALVTMLSADHLDWHGTVENYLAAKANIVRFQGPGDFAVLSETCAPCRELARHTAARVRLYGLENRRPFEIRLPGIHNQLNAQGAFAAADCLDVTWEEAQAALLEFRALPHRLELVHEAGGVRYYNDSIATIPEAAVAALESFPAKKVIQIVGGRLKDGSISDLCGALVNRAKAVLCIGERGPEIAERIAGSTLNAAPPVYNCGDLPTAVRVARLVASAGDVVLLSTACKSYDQFVNFEQRGDAFRHLVRAG
jgi:UDP-N-acetylmuramoylalanine--D-glutamate ligase